MTLIKEFRIVDENGNIHVAKMVTPIKTDRSSNTKFTGLPTCTLNGEHLNTQDLENFTHWETGQKFRKL